MNRQRQDRGVSVPSLWLGHERRSVHERSRKRRHPSHDRVDKERRELSAAHRNSVYCRPGGSAPPHHPPSGQPPQAVPGANPGLVRLYPSACKIGTSHARVASTKGVARWTTRALGRSSAARRHGLRAASTAPVQRVRREVLAPLAAHLSPWGSNTQSAPRPTLAHRPTGRASGSKMRAAAEPLPLSNRLR